MFRWRSVAYWPPLKGEDRSFLGDGTEAGEMALEKF
jgi:hypothetical protein